MSSSPHELQISTEWKGERLDRVLADRVGQLSRSRWQALIKAGHVRLDNRVVQKPGWPLEGGEQLTWEHPEVPPSEDSQGQPIREVPLLHVDQDIIVIDKPAGLLSHRNHAGAAHAVPELVAAQVGALPEGSEPLRPGIVHRLDRGTSGVMVVARTAEAMERLQQAFAERTVQKTYLALTLGSPRFDSEWIEAPIERDPRQPERRRIAREGEGKPASTLLEVRERFGDVAALCEAFPKTGRTHQLRVHLAHRDLPIVGDRLYRPRHARMDRLTPECRRLARPALHAYQLELEHPRTGEAMSFRAPWPNELEAAYQSLKALA